MTASANYLTRRTPMTPATPLNEGIYVPTVAFFTSQDTIDVETTKAHAIRLAESGVAGLVTHGSNGEAVHLDHEERQIINRATRSALDATGKTHLPLITGCGAQSTRETIQLCLEAAKSGASHALVLPPAYYGGLLSTELILGYFRMLADVSPIPILIYNYPAACSGLDLTSDSILALAKYPNIVGVKLTCGNTGKLARVVAGTKGTSFRIFGGSVDFTIQTIAVGGHGIIGGLGNIAPRTCIQVMQLWKNGRQEEAVGLQEIVARGDWVAIKGGFVSVKAALQRYFGYGGLPRQPCAFLEGKALEVQMAGFSELVEAEKKPSILV
ncbi:Fc.00g019630.m01.CDS01 [Cosmosporella sp. VM-42]